MKKIGIIILLTAIIIQGFSQELAAESQESKVNTDESIRVAIGNDLFKIEESDSSVNIRIGNRGLSILESLEGSKIHFEKYDRDYDVTQDDTDRYSSKRKRRFKGHWSGFELGFNNYVTSDRTIALPAEIDYMSIHSGNSMNFNINFAQLNLGLGSHIGFVTGMGISWNNYKFDGNNNILKGDNGIIQELDPLTALKKSKLATVYLDLPFLLEFQIPVDRNTLNIAAGPIGALKIGSHTKMTFQDGRQKVKSYGDFSLNMLRYGATARAGYQNFHIYGTYYMTPLFNSGKGPEGYNLYPFEIGFAITFND